jgi:hypothetical protein
MITNTEIGRKLYGARLFNTNKVLEGMKMVRTSRRRTSWPYSYRHKSSNSAIKTLIKALKDTGVDNFYQFYKGNDLYIGKPNQFEYVFYNAK